MTKGYLSRLKIVLFWTLRVGRRFFGCRPLKGPKVLGNVSVCVLVARWIRRLAKLKTLPWSKENSPSHDLRENRNLSLDFPSSALMRVNKNAP